MLHVLLHLFYLKYMLHVLLKHLLLFLSKINVACFVKIFIVTLSKEIDKNK